MHLKNKKVFVGVSGGVDSSVSAALLKQQGYEVTGVFIKTWNPDFLPCSWKEERRDAMRVCAALDIPFITLDCEKEYKEGVADYLISEYKAGRTPNPDVMCNKEVKFGIFLKKALEMGADYIATGHYCQNINSELYESVDEKKDQSYFLWTLSKDQLAHVLFPIGHLTKPDVRKLASKFKLPTALKKDSQGICFIGKVDMEVFLKHYIDLQNGDVIDVAGNVIGTHGGALLYTVGQRHGFRVSTHTTSEKPYFVIDKDIAKNTITVSIDPVAENSAVKSVILTQVNLPTDSNTLGENIFCRIRYRQPLFGCEIKKSGDFIEVAFNDPQLVALGQSLVFYSEEVNGIRKCLGGGIVERGSLLFL